MHCILARGGKQQPGTWGGATLYPQKYRRGRDTDDLGVFLQKDNTLAQRAQTVANALKGTDCRICLPLPGGFDHDLITTPFNFNLKSVKGNIQNTYQHL